MLERSRIIYGRVRWAAPLALPVALAMASAQAQAREKAITAEVAQRAVTLFAEGKALRKAGGRRRPALALKKSNDVAGNLGSLELDPGLFRDAAEHLSFALRTYASSGSTPEQLAKARAMLAEARQHVRAVRVVVDVQEAEVLVDAKSVGHAPLADDIFVKSGPRVFEARMAGHKEARQTIEAVKGRAQSVTLTLVPTPQVGRSEAAGGGVAKPAANSAAGARNDDTGSSCVSPLVVGGFVAAGAAVSAGIAFTIVSNVYASTAEEQRATIARQGGASCFTTSPSAECEAIKSSLLTKGTFENLSVWSFVGGGVLGAATTIYALSAPPSKPKSAVQAGLAVTASGGGVVIIGQW